MAWIEQINKRSKSGKLFQSDLDSRLFAFDGQVATAWHYRSDPDGAYDTEVNFTPQRVLPGDLPGRWAMFNGWIVREGDYYYGLTITGKLWFVGRGGYRGLGHTLLRSGYVKWSTREWASFVNAAPTWDTGQLTSQVNQVVVNSSGKTLNVENIAVWHDLYPQLPSGNLDLRIQAHGNGLKANPTFDAAAVAWITANRPPTYYFPSTPASDTYLAMLFTLDVADFVRADEPIVFKSDGILQNLIDFDDLDGGANLELSDYLGRVIGWLPVDYALAVDPTTGAVLDRIKLRKRIYLSSGVYYLLVGARTDLLAAMLSAHPGSDLVFDPTVAVDVAASADDGWWRESGEEYNNNGNSMNTGRQSATKLFHSWRRYTGITINGTIDVAYETLNGGGLTGTTVETRMYLEDADNPAAVASAADGNGRALTTAYATWDITAWTADTDYQSPSLVGAFQELVDTYTISGDAIQVIQKNVGTTDGHWTTTRTVDLGAGYAPAIHIEYTEAGGGPTGSPWYYYAQQ